MQAVLAWTLPNEWAMIDNRQHGNTTHASMDAGAAPTSRRFVPEAELPLGAHLVTPRRGYFHHGIYVGNGKVVHYAGLSQSLHGGPVEELTVACFAADHEIWVKSIPLSTYAGHEAVRRARSRLGENHYRLLSNNCEHFCAWCLYGESRSEQVEAWSAHPRMALRAAMSLFKASLKARSQVICATLGTA